MYIQVVTDNHIQGGEELNRLVEAEVQGALGRFAEQLTHVEVHVNDDNSHKGGDNDKRCMIEARPAGLKPIVVNHTAGTVEEAVAGAADKMERSLDKTFGRLGDHKGRTSFGGDQQI